jgi:hypothetical protein
LQELGLDSRHKGPRPKELSERLNKLALRYSRRVGFDRGSERDEENKVRRYVEVFLKDCVNSVNSANRAGENWKG